MATSRTSIAEPGTLDPNFNVTPSSGWTRTTSWLWPSSEVSVASNGRCGAGLNETAISVTRRGSRLPVRR